jgi:Flp pilus assembly protein TadG
MKGVGMVELIVVLPILLVFIMFTAEFGRAFMQYNTLTKTTRDAARYISSKALFGSTGIVQLTPSVEAETRNLLVYGDVVGATSPLLPGLTPADVSIGSVGGEVAVGASYAYTPIFATLPLFQFGADQSATYTFESSMTVRAL